MLPPSFWSADPKSSSEVLNLPEELSFQLVSQGTTVSALSNLLKVKRPSLVFRRLKVGELFLQKKIMSNNYWHLV